MSGPSSHAPRQTLDGIQIPPFRTHSVSSSGNDDPLRQLKAPNWHPWFRFLGYIDPLMVYARADVMVVPSLWNEPFSRVAMEAAAYGIPLIASNRGGLAEVALLVGSILYDSDAPSTLAEVLKQVLADGSKKSGQLRNFSSSQAKHFDPRDCRDRYLSTYIKACT